MQETDRNYEALLDFWIPYNSLLHIFIDTLLEKNTSLAFYHR